MRKILFLFALSAFFLINTPAQARVMVACTMEAKICPDGSAVARRGPNCEFAPCPGETGIAPDGQEEAETGVMIAPEIEPVYPDQAQPVDWPWPDRPLSSVPKGAITVEFLFEHRSALVGHVVSVRGTVDTTLLKEKACPPNMGMCAQPRITLRGKDLSDPYRVTILLREDNDTHYKPNTTVTIRGRVTGSGASLMMHEE